VVALGTFTLLDITTGELAPFEMTGYAFNAPLQWGTFTILDFNVGELAPFELGSYALAGTVQPAPCPDCPELPVGVIWAPGGRFGQERP